MANSHRWLVQVVVEDDGLAPDNEVREVLIEQFRNRLCEQHPSENNRFNEDEIVHITAVKIPQAS